MFRHEKRFIQVIIYDTPENIIRRHENILILIFLYLYAKICEKHSPSILLFINNIVNELRKEERQVDVLINARKIIKIQTNLI